MKKIFNNIYRLGFLAALLISPLYSYTAVHAEGSVSFDPQSVTAPKDSLITLHVKGSANEFNAAQVDILYDASALQYVSYSTSGSVLPTTFGFINNTGALKIVLYSTTAAKGSNQELISYTFKAIKDNTTSSVKFAPSTLMVNNGQKVAGPIGQSSIKVSSTEPASSPNVVKLPTGDTTAPKIDQASPMGFVDGPIFIKVSSDEAVNAQVKYGKTDDMRYEASSGEHAKTIYVDLGTIASALQKNSQNSFQVTVTDDAGNQSTAEIQPLFIEPVTLDFVIKDNAGKPIANADVLVNGKDFKSDGKGNVKVEKAIPGIAEIWIKNGDQKTYYGEMTVVKGDKVQSFAATPTGVTPTKASLVERSMLPLASILGLVVLVTAIYMIMRRRKHRVVPADNHAADPAAPQPLQIRSNFVPPSAGDVISPQTINPPSTEAPPSGDDPAPNNNSPR